MYKQYPFPFHRKRTFPSRASNPLPWQVQWDPRVHWDRLCTVDRLTEGRTALHQCPGQTVTMAKRQ